MGRLERAAGDLMIRLTLVGQGLTCRHQWRRLVAAAGGGGQAAHIPLLVNSDSALPHFRISPSFLSLSVLTDSSKNPLNLWTRARLPELASGMAMLDMLQDHCVEFCCLVPSIDEFRIGRHAY